jgi:hypothetical protein
MLHAKFAMYRTVGEWFVYTKPMQIFLAGYGVKHLPKPRDWKTEDVRRIAWLIEKKARRHHD